jgi:membrane-associated phospholipid phosphatase
MYAVGASLAALAMVGSLRWVVPIDERVFQWLQFHRSCRVIHGLPWIDPLVRVGLGLLIGVALARGAWREPRKLVPLVVLFIAGLATVELLKTAIERLRPNSMPGTMTGNSFPSGHATGATMVAVIAVLMLREAVDRSLWRWSLYASAFCLVVLQGVGRLINGSHWLSDIVGSMLLGSAWVLGVRALPRLPRAAMWTLVGVGGVAFVVFDGLPAARLRLPSALEEHRAALASVEFGTPKARASLGSGWADGPAEPIGPVSWAMSPEVGVNLRTSAAGGVLKVTLRPGTANNDRTCSRMVVSVNGWQAPAILLTRGWREYHFEPPAGTLRPGDNAVRFRIVAEPGTTPEEPGSGLAAFRYLRLYPKA